MRDGYAGTSIRAVARRAGRRRGDRPPRVCEQGRPARRHDPAGDPASGSEPLARILEAPADALLRGSPPRPLAVMRHAAQ
jgi:hypothetical protein